MAAPQLQQWYDDEFGPTGTANGGAYADKSYWICTENWGGSYPEDLGVYYKQGGFFTASSPMFIIIGYQNKVYYNDGASDFRAVLRQAIDEMPTPAGVYLVNPISDRTYWPNDVEDIDISNVFEDAEGDPLTFTVESNSDPSVANAVIDGNTLTLTAGVGTSGTTTIILKGEDVPNAESKICEFVVTLETAAPILIWDFESDLQGWTIGGTTTTWQYKNAKAIPSSGSKFLYIDSDIYGNGVNVKGDAMSPVVDLSDYSSGEVRMGFKYYLRIYVACEFQLRYTTNGGITWNLMQDLGGTGSWIEGEELVVPDGALTATTQFGFWYDDLNNWEWYAGIDDIYLSAIPTVAPGPTTAITPIDNAIDTVIDGSLEWSGVIRASDYKLFFGTDNPPTNILNGVALGNATSYDYSDLSTRKRYYWQVVPYNYLGEATGCPVWDFLTFDNEWNGATINPLTVDVSVKEGMSTTDIVTINAGGLELNYSPVISYGSKSKSYEIVPNTVYNSSPEKSKTSFLKDPNPNPIIIENDASVKILKGTSAYAFSGDPSLYSFNTGSPGTQTEIASLTGYYYAADFGKDDKNIMYGLSHNDKNLYSIDVTTGTETLIGYCPHAQSLWTDFACNKSTGVMYGTTTDVQFNTSQLHVIDITTGSSTYIGDLTGVKAAIALAIDGSGIGYTYCSIQDKSYTIDLATGVCTELGDIGFDANYAQSMSWDPESDNIYLTAYSTFGEFRLLDRSTGATYIVGELPDNRHGLGFSGKGWLTLTDGIGSIAAGGTQDVTLNFDAADYGVGTVKTATLRFKDEFGNVYSNPINVSMTITDGSVLDIPANVVTSISGTNLVVDWDASAGATSYDVYSSDDPYGTFTFVTNVDTNQYTVAADQAKLFYYIIAKN